MEYAISLTCFVFGTSTEMLFAIVVIKNVVLSKAFVGLRKANNSLDKRFSTNSCKPSPTSFLQYSYLFLFHLLES